MNSSLWLLILLVPAALLLYQLPAALGKVRGGIAGMVMLLASAGAWLLLGSLSSLPAEADASNASVTSDTCFKCHADHYASWRRTYHRTMTREATPEFVKGDFNDVTYVYRGIPTHLTRDGDDFYMETLDQAWADRVAQLGPNRPAGLTPRFHKYKVERLVGSHWFQECMMKDERGAYWRLPVSYHIVEKRWIHTNGAFLSPDTDDFWSKSSVWNESCVFCHNTKPSKQPQRQPWDESRVVGYATEVAELGIACEACHGPGAEHVRVNQNLARRYATHGAGGGDATIVNPRRLSVERSDDICAHCHGAIVPKAQTWDAETVTDPFNAGEDLKRCNDFFWSEAEQMRLYERQGARRPATVPGAVPSKPVPDAKHGHQAAREPDGRFWGDGTPLTTALEFQGMALSACYQGGHGKLSCLSCHSLHDSDPNFMLKRGMDSNDACYQCHSSYKDRLAQHTHHNSKSSGSLCYNCHMPYQVYSLLTTHRSHRIEGLRVQDSAGTGKPHACNLCHLDKSLGWTQDRLGEWYGRPAITLSDNERKFSSALLHLCQSDARSRVIVAGAFSWEPAQKASGTDWMGPILTRLLESERFPAVRYLGARGLRSVSGRDGVAYDYLAGRAERDAQLQSLRGRRITQDGRATRSYPYLPLDDKEQPIETILRQLLQKRNDPDVSIHE